MNVHKEFLRILEEEINPGQKIVGYNKSAHKAVNSIVQDLSDRVDRMCKQEYPEFDNMMKHLVEFTAPPKDGDYDDHVVRAMEAVYEYIVFGIKR